MLRGTKKYPVNKYICITQNSDCIDSNIENCPQAQ